MLNKAKVGDAVCVDNTIFVKQPGNVWKSAFDSYMESTFARYILGKKVNYLFLEPKESKKVDNSPKKVEESNKDDNSLLDIKPKEIKNVQERKKQNK